MKILVTYDIDEEDESVRKDIEKTLKTGLDWIKLQKSVWIIRSNKSNDNDIFVYIKNKFENENSIVSTIDISNKIVKYNGYDELKNNNSLLLFTSKY